MARNPTSEKMGNRLVNQLNLLSRQMRELQAKFALPYLIFPYRTSDPPVTKLGQAGLYYNSNTAKWRKSVNGGAWADTTI
jgi:hypothetical protein